MTSTCAGVGVSTIHRRMTSTCAGVGVSTIHRRMPSTRSVTYRPRRVLDWRLRDGDSKHAVEHMADTEIGLRGLHYNPKEASLRWFTITFLTYIWGVIYSSLVDGYHCYMY